MQVGVNNHIIDVDRRRSVQEHGAVDAGVIEEIECVSLLEPDLIVTGIKMITKLITIYTKYRLYFENHL